MNITYKTIHITSKEFQAACDLVNAGKQLSIVLKEERLLEVPFVVVALHENKVVGVSCIKNYGAIAEIGYTAVYSGYRRNKIGTSMTKRLIDHALKHEVGILRGIVYESNVANRNKLEKLGFFEVSKYRSKTGDRFLCWYCHPLLKTETRARLMMNKFLKEKEVPTFIKTLF